MEAGDDPGALRFFHQAVQCQPCYGAAYYQRGLVRLQTHDYQGAIADYNQALRLDPNFALAYYRRGLVRYRLRDQRGAMGTSAGLCCRLSGPRTKAEIKLNF